MKLARRAALLASAIAIVVVPVALAAPAIDFDPVVVYDAAVWTGSGSGSMTTADFNVDGHPDLVVVDSPSRSVSVVLNNGDGTFSPPQKTVSSVLDVYAVASGDFDGDGLPDIAAGSDLASFTGALLPDLTIMLGNGDGTFRLADTYQTGVFPQQIAVTDFDLDGRLDLGVVGGAGDVTVLLGAGDGTFRPGPTARAGRGTTSIAAADLNGDGHPNLAVADGFFRLPRLDEGTVWVLLWDPARRSLSPAADYAVAAVPEQVAAGDLNHDGRVDLVTANAGAGEISVLVNTGSDFSPRAFPIGEGGAGAAIADFDGDGNPDLAVGRSVADQVSVLAGTGTGAFGRASDFAAPGGPQAMAIDDYDGDGRLDIAAAVRQGIAVLLNASAEPSPP